MSTILIFKGWRLFFYSNERNEPPHIHAKKGGMDCKFWLFPDRYDIEEVYGYGLTNAERRSLRRIIFENFDYLLERYEAVHRNENE